MARITTGPIVADIRGKSGDQIFSRNRYGLYVKTFAAPTGTPSAAMIQARDNMTDVVAAWIALSTTNRNRWIQLCASLKLKARRTPHENITPYNLFVRCNCWRLLIGLSITSTPGAITALPRYSVDITYPGTTGIEGELTWQSGSSNWRLLLYGSAAFETSRYSPNVSPYKFVGFATWTANNSPENTNFSQDWPTVWDEAEIPFQKIVFIKMQAVNIATGQKTAPVIFRVYVNV